MKAGVFLFSPFGSNKGEHACPQPDRVCLCDSTRLEIKMTANGCEVMRGKEEG